MSGSAGARLRRLSPPAAAMLAVALFAATAGQPFHLDNVDFPAAAEAAALVAKLVVGPGVKLKGAEIQDCDTLLVEARISPTDIGFVTPGQPVDVRLTAFDHAIYGSLSGKVHQISPDLIAAIGGQCPQPDEIMTVRRPKQLRVKQFRTMELDDRLAA